MAGWRRPAATALIVAAALVAIVVGSCGSGADDDVQAIDIEFELLNDGTANVRSFLDRPVVLNFFASWCTPCKAEMPALESVHLNRPDIAIIGVAFNDTRTRAREIVQETGVTYTIGLDANTPIGDAFEVVRMPTTLFIAPDGEIVYRHTGGLTADEVTRLIDTHLTP